MLNIILLFLHQYTKDRHTEKKSSKNFFIKIFFFCFSNFYTVNFSTDSFSPTAPTKEEDDYEEEEDGNKEIITPNSLIHLSPNQIDNNKLINKQQQETTNLYSTTTHSLIRSNSTILNSNQQKIIDSKHLTSAKSAFQLVNNNNALNSAFNFPSLDIKRSLSVSFCKKKVYGIL